MKAVPSRSHGPAKPSTPTNPWEHLAPGGRGLSVGDFVTTVVSYAGNALRRTITQSYAEKYGLTISEWRILSVLAHAEELQFSDLVMLSATDKAQVSRTVKLMAARGLVDTEVQGRTRGQKVVCKVTKEGADLYRQVMPIAQRRQAAMLLRLSKEERTVLYRALKKLRAFCDEESAGVHLGD